MAAKPATRQRKRLIIVISVLAAAVAGGLVWHHKTKPYHFLTVQEGVLYRSGCLNMHHLEKVVDTYNIRTIVALRLETEDDPRPGWFADEQTFCRQRGLQFVHIPMKGNTPPTPQQLDQWLDLLDNRENHPILVHCAQGVVRTGIMVALYEIEYRRKDNRTTLEELPMFGHELYVPKRQEMRDFILNYKPRWKSSD